MKQLVLIHGRSQQGKDPIALKGEWIDAWGKGLAKSGLDVPLEAGNIHFPYYGDTLQQVVDGSSTSDAAKIIVRGAEQSSDVAAAMTSILNQYMVAMNIAESEVRAALHPSHRSTTERGAQNWPWVLAILRAMDQHVPGSAELVALVTYDVYMYLTNSALRQHIEDGVSNAIRTDNESVFVTHSLGTIVGYTLLNLPKHRDVKVPLMVTLGSPLGITAIREKIRPIRTPPSVERWYNARDPKDVVALFPLDDANFPVTPSIRNNNDVCNWTANKHGIVGYLDDKEVARQIYEALI